MRLLLLFLGCHAASPIEKGRFAAPLVASAPETDAIVATVDGRPIRASQVADQARAAGSSAKDALAVLVDAEVLVSEAARRGIDQNLDAQEAAEAVAVRRLLASSFEVEVTPASVPLGLVKKIYEKNRLALDHDLEVDVWHILVPTRGLDDAKKAAARVAAEDLAKRARAVHDLEAFKALAATVPGGKYEHVVTEKDGWTLKEFSYPAFEQLHQPGDVSSVVETSFGFHVMYLVGLVPPRHTSLAEAEPELRKGVFPEFQKPEFIHFCERLAGDHQITLHAEKLQ
jgi:hypothetical protein